jgi:NAD(P)-dependent dehydrogenase (short-subunit alcohol dehydrogenase family)
MCGHIDILVNNASIMNTHGMADEGAIKTVEEAGDTAAELPNP